MLPPPISAGMVLPLYRVVVLAAFLCLSAPIREENLCMHGIAR